MEDKFYKKQLETLGTDYTQVVIADVRNKFAEEDRDTTNSVIRALMEETAGRYWVYMQLDRCHVFTTPFMPGQPDVTAYHAGCQAYGQELLAEIMNSAPESFWKMIQEATARRESRKQEIEQQKR